MRRAGGQEMKTHLICALPFIPLLPRAAWEKVAEGRMRALSRSGRGSLEHLLCNQRALTRPLAFAKPKLRFDRARLLRFGGARSGALSHCFATGEGENRRGKGALDAPRQLPWPPHLPVTALKFPQPSGLRQSEMRSFEPSR